MTNIEEERIGIFRNWAEDLINGDLENCDTCATLLLHTLSENGTCRKDLESWVNQVTETYKKELKMLEGMMQVQMNPFQKEQLKLKKPELDEWKVKEIHNRFYQTFIENNLIPLERK